MPHLQVAESLKNALFERQAGTQPRRLVFATDHAHEDDEERSDNKHLAVARGCFRRRHASHSVRDSSRRTVVASRHATGAT